MKATNINSKKRIAFAVHPDKKTDLIEWSYFNKELLMQHEIIASGDAANILEGTLHKPVTTFLTGPNESYQELCNLIADGKVDAIIFLRGADETPLQKNSIKTIMHAALEADIIIAGNKRSAEFILTSPLMNKGETINESDYTLEEQANISLKKNNAA